METNEITKFWQRLDILRGKMFLKDLCNHTGINLSTIKKLRTDGRLPNLLDAKKIAGYLGCSLDYLLTGHIPDNDYSPQEKQLIANYRQCPLHYRIAAESILKENTQPENPVYPSYYVHVDPVSQYPQTNSNLSLKK